MNSLYEQTTTCVEQLEKGRSIENNLSVMLSSVEGGLRFMAGRPVGAVKTDTDYRAAAAALTNIRDCRQLLTQLIDQNRESASR